MPKRGNKIMGGSPSTGESDIGPNDAIIRLTVGANESKLIDDITSVLSKTFPDKPLAIMDDQDTGEVVMSTSAQSSKAGLPVGARAREDTPVKRIKLNMVDDNQLKAIEEYNLAKKGCYERHARISKDGRMEKGTDNLEYIYVPSTRKCRIPSDTRQGGDYP